MKVVDQRLELLRRRHLALGERRDGALKRRRARGPIRRRQIRGERLDDLLGLFGRQLLGLQVFALLFIGGAQGGRVQLPLDEAQQHHLDRVHLLYVQPLRVGLIQRVRALEVGKYGVAALGADGVAEHLNAQGRAAAAIVVLLLPLRGRRFLAHRLGLEGLRNKVPFYRRRALVLACVEHSGLPKQQGA